MKRIFLLILCSLFLCLPNSAYAQKKTKVKSKIKTKKKQISISQYLNQYRGIAITESKRTNVPASITLAQGILESAYGNSYLARKGKNHFGIKCSSKWKSKKIYARGTKKCYRKYKSAYASYIDHSNFLRTNDRYKDLFDLASWDYEKWAKGLQTAGYASDPDYTKKLLQIIEKHELYNFDNESYFSEGGDCEVQVLSTTFSFNGLKMVVFDCPVTPRRISQAYDVSVAELLEYNPFKEDEEVAANTVIFLESLKKRGPKGIPKHMVTQDETIETIAHLYGMDASNLYSRNRLKRGQKPVVGSYVYLRGKAPKN